MLFLFKHLHWQFEMKIPVLLLQRYGDFYYDIMIEFFADYKIPCAIIALATFINPAMLAPFT